MNTSNSILESLGKILAYAILAVVQFISRGWAISSLWNWFIAPPFHVPTLGIVTAVGFAFAVQILTFDFPKAMREAKKDDSEFGEKIKTSLSISLVAYPVCVLVGYIIHWML